MAATMHLSNNHDDLTCPITLELYRDPVIALDGRVYEREAIIRWINAHGTSPFTRQPLRVEDLQPDDCLRRLAAERRNSTVSYNAHTDRVTLPPVKLPSRYRQTRVSPSTLLSMIPDSPTNGCLSKYCVFIICAVCTVAVVATIIGIALTSNDKTTVGYNRRNTSSVFGTYESLSTVSIAFKAGACIFGGVLLLLVIPSTAGRVI